MVKSPACQYRCKRYRFNPWIGKNPLEKGMVTHFSILAWRIPMVRGAWRATVHGVAESQTHLSDEAQHKEASVAGAEGGRGRSCEL